MRRWAFTVAILGIFVLSFFLNFGGKEISDGKKLEKLEINTRVFVSGIVESERTISNGRKLMNLENRIVLVCECSGIFVNEKVFVEGVVSEFEEEKQITVLRISVLENDS